MLSTIQLLLILVASTAPAAPVQRGAGPSSLKPVGLIIDTDIGGGGCNDVDDVIAVAVGHALADNGEAKLLAVVLNTAPINCAGAISVLNHYYSRDKTPIGAYNYKTVNATLDMQAPLPYVDMLVRDFPSPIKNSTQVT